MSCARAAATNACTYVRTYPHTHRNRAAPLGPDGRGLAAASQSSGDLLWEDPRCIQAARPGRRSLNDLRLGRQRPSHPKQTSSHLLLLVPLCLPQLLDGSLDHGGFGAAAAAVAQRQLKRLLRALRIQRGRAWRGGGGRGQTDSQGGTGSRDGGRGPGPANRTTRAG